MKNEDLGVLYNVSGFYMFGGMQYDFTGEFFIDIVKHINGRIWDPGSICDEHRVAGTIIDSGKIGMEFVKIPTGMLVDIHYKLEKEAEPFDSLVGRYKGNWSFNEEVIPIVEGTEGETKNFVSMVLKKAK